MLALSSLARACRRIAAALRFPAPLLIGFLGASVAGVQAQTREIVPWPTVDAPAGWYSGSTHDHIQICGGSLIDVSVIQRILDVRSIDVSCLLIWNAPGPYPYNQFICNVTGAPLAGTGHRVIQYGVETSQLDCSGWGHLIGLNIGAPEARIAVATDVADCHFDPVGLGLGCAGGDGTGSYSAPIARHFANAPRAVRGMAHQAWPLGIYSPQGFDWDTELLQTGTTTDALVLDPSRKLAFPNVFSDPTNRLVFAAFGAIDVALGNIEFLETVSLEPRYNFVPGDPKAHWFGALYKILSAGLRVTPSAGVDTGCGRPIDDPNIPRTYVETGGPLTYDTWTAGLAAGRTTLSRDDALFLDFDLEGEPIGSLVHATATDTLRLDARLTASGAAFDRVELLRDGRVVARKVVRIGLSGGTDTVSFDVPAVRSSWFAVRLASERAHTAASYAIVDDRAVASCEEAEYWMTWCDRITRAIETAPAGQYFGCQDADVLADVSEARHVFRALRDYDFYDGGFDPVWRTTRFGRSVGACHGPIQLSVVGPVLAGQPIRFLCLNAPAGATGTLYLASGRTSGTCVANVELFLEPSGYLSTFEVTATASGTAQIVVDDPVVMTIPADTLLYAQILWDNPGDCMGLGCDGGLSSMSSSDALEILVQ